MLLSRTGLVLGGSVEDLGDLHIYVYTKISQQAYEPVLLSSPLFSLIAVCSLGVVACCFDYSSIHISNCSYYYDILGPSSSSDSGMCTSILTLLLQLIKSSHILCLRYCRLSRLALCNIVLSSTRFTYLLRVGLNSICSTMLSL